MYQRLINTLYRWFYEGGVDLLYEARHCLDQLIQAELKRESQAVDNEAPAE